MSASERRSRTALGGVVAVVLVATALLHLTGTGELAAPPLTQPGRWGTWLSERDPLVAAMAVLRLLALATAWYVLATTLLAVALRLARVARLVSVADRLTVPAVRRLLVSAAGVTLVSGVTPSFALALGPQLPAAVAAPAPSSATAAGLLPSTPSTTTATVPGEGPARPPPTLTMRLLPPEEAPVAAVPQGGAAHDRSAPATADGSWTVRPGECFWSIAEDVLARARGRPVQDGEIVPYWQRLIDANRHVLADEGNPDLIFPGQVFMLPALPPG